MTTGPAREVRPLSRADIMPYVQRGGVCSVAVTDRALPVVVPANYVVVGDSLYIKAANNSVLARTAPGRVVGVGIHATEPVSPLCWSLSLAAIAELVPPDQQADIAELATLRPWHDGDGDDFVLRLSLDLIIGHGVYPAAGGALPGRTGGSVGLGGEV